MRWVMFGKLSKLCLNGLGPACAGHVWEAYVGCICLYGYGHVAKKAWRQQRLLERGEQEQIFIVEKWKTH